MNGLKHKTHIMTKSNTQNQKVRLVNFLASGEEKTTAQVRNTLRIANPSAVVAALRQDGFAIYTNKRTLKNGRTVFKYRLNVKRA